MNFSQDMNVYTEEGRNKSGYKKLVLEGALKERWRVRNKYDDVEFLDNSISKISAQQRRVQYQNCLLPMEKFII